MDLQLSKLREYYFIIATPDSSTALLGGHSHDYQLVKESVHVTEGMPSWSWARYGR